MTSFKDNAGTKWTLTVDVLSIKKVRAATGVDLSKLFKDQAEKLFDDIEMFVDVLWTLVEDEAIKRGVGMIEFVKSLTGDAIENAQDAIVEEVLCFFPTGQAAPTRLTMKKNKLAQKILQRKAMLAAEAMTPEQLADAVEAYLKAEAEKKKNDQTQ